MRMQIDESRYEQMIGQDQVFGSLIADLCFLGREQVDDPAAADGQCMLGEQDVGFDGGDPARFNQQVYFFSGHIGRER